MLQLVGTSDSHSLQELFDLRSIWMKVYCPFSNVKMNRIGLDKEPIVTPRSVPWDVSETMELAMVDERCNFSSRELVNDRPAVVVVEIDGLRDEIEEREEGEVGEVKVESPSSFFFRVWSRGGRRLGRQI